ncbi:hypothetical protein [Nocardioides humi]
MPTPNVSTDPGTAPAADPTAGSAADPSVYLAALPPVVQSQLVALVKAAADTGEGEKGLILGWLDQAVSRLFTRMVWQEHAKLVELLAHLGMLLGALHEQSRPKEVA